MILDFQMNSLVTVEPLGQGLWRVTARYDDNLFAAELGLEIQLPALDIKRAGIDVKRDVVGLVPDLSNAMANLVGVRVGQGMTKIVRGVVGGSDGSDRVADLVMEAMEMLINALTVPQLKQAMEVASTEIQYHRDGPKVYLNDRVTGDDAVKLMAQNPRLKDSCVAFAGLDT
ncbi:MAG: hypothetical protein HY914_00765 [Desulfomonile tiedjei]|nr:hypothetical protein [Desulfomonile tiedjei]